MALFDNNPLYENISSLANPITSKVSGLLDGFSGMNVFGARPSEALTSILTKDQQDKLRNQALFQGLLGTAATYLATPKNLNVGSALPYLGKAFLGGMQASQGTVDRATQNLITKNQMAEFQRETEAAKLTRETQQELLKDKRVQDSPLLKALVFTTLYLDLNPILSKTLSSSNIRVNQIKGHIRNSKFGIHDLSRNKPMALNELPRFNMPYELGLDIGAAEYGNTKLKTKRALILDTERFHYQKVISDVNKCEDLIKFHKQQSVRNSGDQFRRKLKQFIDSYNKLED